MYWGHFPSNLDVLVFEERGVPGEKPRGAEKRTNNKLNPHMTPGMGGERSHHCAIPAPHCVDIIIFPG